MTQLLPRLPHSIRTRRKISQKLKGVPKSPEHRAKIAAAMSGRKHSPATLERLTLLRRARRPAPKTDEEIVADCRRRNRRKAKRQLRERFKQRSIDMAVARELGDEALRLDIRKSWGWHSRRKMHHPKVSDGFYKKRDKVMWTPWLKKLRTE